MSLWALSFGCVSLSLCVYMLGQWYLKGGIKVMNLQDPKLDMCFGFSFFLVNHLSSLVEVNTFVSCTWDDFFGNGK